MEVIRLLHLSDLHFFWESEQSDFDRLQAKYLSAVKEKDPSLPLKFPRALFGCHKPYVALAVAKFVYKNREALDGIVITGDLATTGLSADLKEAFYYISASCRYKWQTDESKPSINLDNLPIIILPGNHDRYRDQFGNAGGKEFDNIFRDYWPQEDRINTSIFQLPDGNKFAIISADFSLRRNSDAGLGWHLGRGKAYSTTTNELIKTTRRIKRDGYNAVLWAIHFPPSLPDEKTSLKLLEGEKIVTAAQQCGIRHLLAGHIHNSKKYNLNNLEVFCASSSMSRGESNQVHIITINIDGGSIASVNVSDHAYDPLQSKFV